FRLLGDEFAHPRRVGLLVAVGVAFEFLAQGRGEGQGPPRMVVDHLGIDVLQTLVDGEPWSLGGPGQLSPDATLPLEAMVSLRHGGLVSVRRGWRLPPLRMKGGLGRPGLAFLTADAFLDVLDALALVRLGGA